MNTWQPEVRPAWVCPECHCDSSNSVRSSCLGAEDISTIQHTHKWKVSSIQYTCNRCRHKWEVID